MLAAEAAADDEANDEADDEDEDSAVAARRHAGWLGVGAYTTALDDEKRAISSLVLMK